MKDNCQTKEPEKVYFSVGSIEYLDDNPTTGIIHYEGNRAIIFVKSIVTDITIGRMDISKEIQEIYLVKEGGNSMNVTLHWNKPVYLNGVMGPSSMPVISGNLIQMVRREYHEWHVLSQAIDLNLIQESVDEIVRDMTQASLALAVINATEQAQAYSIIAQANATISTEAAAEVAELVAGLGYEDRPTAQAALASLPLTVQKAQWKTPGGLVSIIRRAGPSLPGMDGWVPDGQIFPDHFAENTVPNSTDMTTAIQAALDYTGSLMGGDVLLGPGNRRTFYRTTDTIHIRHGRVRLLFNGCEINLDDPTGLKSNLKIGTGLVRGNGCGAMGPGALTRVQAATAGYGIESDLVGGLVLGGWLGVYCDSKIWRGIRLFRAIKTRLEVDVSRSIDADIVLEGSDYGENGTTDTFFGRSYFSRGLGDGIIVGDYVGGVFFDQFPIVYGCAGDGLTFAAAGPGSKTSSVVGKLNIDTVGGHAIVAQHVGNVDLSGGWISGTGLDAVVTGVGVDDFKFDNGLIYVSGSNVAFDLQAGTNIQANGTSCAGGAGGYRFGAAVTEVSIRGGVVRNTSGAAFTLVPGAKRVTAEGVALRSVGSVLSGEIIGSESRFDYTLAGVAALIVDTRFVGLNLNADNFVNPGVSYGQFLNIFGATRNGWLETFPSNAADVAMQRFTHNNSDAVYIRRKVAGTWINWRQLAVV